MENSKKPPKKHRPLLQSMGSAIEGIVYVLENERNMRVHFLIGFFVIIGSIYFDFHYLEVLALLFAVAFVFAAEMFNSAVEYLSNVVVEEQFHPVIKVIKDISAGAVFIAAFNAALVAYILVVNRMRVHRGQLFARIMQSPWHITLIALITCIALVLLIKIIRREKNLLKGGMPSGHTALAFGIWVATWAISSNSLVSILVFFLALLVARSRMSAGIHTFWEVVVGAMIGALTSLLIFQVLL
ncbi:MAG: diacylglycerol kinase [Candidatus Omnitrophica bacterium]|nr:diacylglycerol kinase [Candidatus Omnitrophota bacterium]